MYGGGREGSTWFPMPVWHTWYGTNGRTTYSQPLKLFRTFLEQSKAM